MSKVSDLKARGSWLLSYADLVTLLITFFIMMLALYHTEISRMQNWANFKMDQSFQQLTELIESKDYRYLGVFRSGQGLHIYIQHPEAFEQGGYQLAENLAAELVDVAEYLTELPMFEAFLNQFDSQAPRDPIIQRASLAGLNLQADVRIEGHTDDIPIAAGSRMRNNWVLSTLRAQEVMQSLYQASGLPADTFAIAGRAEFDPVVPHDSPENRALNRRIEVIITLYFVRD
ncbi:OmpA family protein [Thiomicrospira sp. ALE5]|uniref:OmpA/MotB family protein n=1 Tax=Thiomicrospira sp. ALE5 TaxID=748650 RepID=UPI0008E4E476|nr:OmpA family protein [Thiomicrospira sp. ALE5]SFR52384.1 chemotaxis protein MotB [Thiomicrospira sp. ALE5]